MSNNGLDCADPARLTWMINNRCNNDQGWINNRYCELSCTAGGVGYGRTCCPMPTPPPGLCGETCHSPDDGVCDDGGPGSEHANCNLGTDCTDCGVRALGPSAPPSPPGLWSVTSGSAFCEVTPDGACVTDGEGNYGNGEECTVQALASVTW
jgi:hypothetical protein